METKVISYNLRDRGRQYTGQPRNFDIPRLITAINGPACQERVRNRDMVGFYGHWPRIKFGMHPAEGGLSGGKAHTVEPALITTYLRAFPDGTVEHKAEFLPTQPGQIAAKLYQSRTGGFSSAIDQIKPEFFGFDYVLEPNFTTNRGYSLDSVLCEGGACAVGMDCDSVNAAILEEQLAGMAALIDAVSASQTLAEQTISALEAENAELRYQLDDLRAKADKINALDSAPRGPLIVSADALHRLRADTEAFLSLDSLPLPVQRPLGASKAAELDPAVSRFIRRLGI